jgi:hypothetical protein
MSRLGLGVIELGYAVIRDAALLRVPQELYLAGEISKFCDLSQAFSKVK